MCRWLALAMLVSGSTRAQVLFESSFDTPGSVSGAGWTSTERSGPVDLVQHRAGRVGPGARFSRLDAGAGYVRLLADRLGVAGPNAAIRYWVRVDDWWPEPSVVFPLQLRASGIGSVAETPIESLADGGVVMRLLVSQNPVGAEGLCRPDADVHLTRGAWHLVELWATGMGTDAGVARFALDGQPVCERALDWAGRSWRVIWFGAVNSTTASAVIDLDEVRWLTRPAPSRLELRSGPPRDGCHDVFVRATTTFDAGAPGAPLRVRLTGTRADGLPVEWCETRTVILERLDDDVLAASVRDGADVELVAEADDLVPARLGLDLGQDPVDGGGGDLGPGERRLRVGCGCVTPGGGLTLTLLALVLRRRRPVRRA